MPATTTQSPTSDPTAFPIEFDPRSQRMRGVALHGNTPFDVPFITPITDNLWTGGCQTGLRLPEEVTHLVSLYRWEEYDVWHDLDSTLTVKMYDSLDGPNTTQVIAIADWVNECRKTGITLVHCQAGLNRSGMVAAVALIRDGMGVDEAIDLLRSKRSPAVLCNGAFVEWLHDNF